MSTPNSECTLLFNVSVKVWPDIFISASIQMVIYLVFLWRMLSEYQSLILKEISFKLKLYWFFMFMRPLIVGIFQLIKPEIYDDIPMTFIFLFNFFLNLLFYYLLFRMKLMQLFFTYNIKQGELSNLKDSSHINTTYRRSHPSLV